MINFAQYHFGLFLLVSGNDVTPLECSPISSHNHMTLLIRNLLDTPLHVYKPLKLHQIGIDQFVIVTYLTGELATPKTHQIAKSLHLNSSTTTQ
jgi:hypothetical protein